jgi:cysteinyl-tRNA synthetase
MAITQRRLQQIIQEEVDFYLREQDEEGEALGAEEEEPEAEGGDEVEGVEGAVGALENAAFEAERKALLATIEARTAEEKATALESLKALVDKYDLDIDIDSQIAALQKLASDLASEAQKAGTSADQAQSALEQINAILGGVGQSSAEVTSEGRLLELWNTLAFGRKLL